MKTSPVTNEAMTEDMLKDAARWRHLRQHWATAQFHNHRDGRLRAITIRIVDKPGSGDSTEIDKQVDRMIEEAAR